MGKNSGIQWTHHTFNPWRGCTKVSCGCANCYAEELSKINPKFLGLWGTAGTRVVASERKWQEPLAWDDEARRSGVRKRVFCASLADVFEDWPGKMINSNGHAIYKGPLGGWLRSQDGTPPKKGSLLRMDDVRSRLFGLIVATPRLDWQIVTKWPDIMTSYFRSQETMWWAAAVYSDLVYSQDVGLGDGLRHWPPRNAWLGTSVENQEQANLRIPELLKTPATVRFLSMEPLLEHVDLRRWMSGLDVSRDEHGNDLGSASGGSDIDWVIVGGESGSKARPFHVNWARLIKDDCERAGVAFFMKQLGSYPIDHDFEVETDRRVPLEDSRGGDPAEWPEDLRIRQFPQELSSVPER